MVPPALRGSARQPVGIGPPGLGAGVQEARGRGAGGGGRSPPQQHPESGRAGGPGAELSCEQASEARAGREEGRKERAASKRGELAEGASEGRQAVRSSFESNCLSQEEMWHLMLGEERGKGPSARSHGPSSHPGLPGPPFPPPRVKLPQANYEGPLHVSGLTDLYSQGGGCQ